MDKGVVKEVVATVVVVIEIVVVGEVIIVVDDSVGEIDVPMDIVGESDVDMEDSDEDISVFISAVDCPLVVIVEEAPIEVDVSKLDVVEVEFEFLVVVVLTVCCVCEDVEVLVAAEELMVDALVSVSGVVTDV